MAEPTVLPPVAAPAESLTVPTVIYVLYGVGFFFPPAALVGVIMAHTGMANAGTVSLAHFSYQARTFWFGLLTLSVSAMVGLSYVVVNFAAMMAETPHGAEWIMPEGVPPVLMLAGAIWMWWLVWTLVRILKGFVTVLSRRPMPKPRTLLW